MEATKENSGLLFKNLRKEQENHCDYAGVLNVRGEQFWVNAWIKQGKNGKYFSFSVKPKQQDRQQQQKPKLAVAGGTDMDDEIPF